MNARKTLSFNQFLNDIKSKTVRNNIISKLNENTSFNNEILEKFE